MKILPLIAFSGAFLAVPATAGVAHGTSLAHEGSTISVSYEPRSKTDLRQAGLGPRGSASCIWTTEVSVERKLADASGRPIEPLTRTVGQPKIAEGVQPGYCAQVEAAQVALFGGNSERLQAYLAQVAASDKDDSMPNWRASDRLDAQFRANLAEPPSRWRRG